MARYRYAGLAVVALGVGSLGGKCDDLEDEDTSILPNASGGTGGSAGVGGEVECAPGTQCSIFAPNAPGSECMARRDNTKPAKYPGRRQMRSVWNRNMSPPGLESNSILNDTLDAAVELDFGLECNSKVADTNGGYILAFDWDTTPPEAEQVAWVGYVDRVPKGQEATALDEGLCMAGFKHEATWTAFGRQVAGAAPTFPTETWNVKPSRNQRVMADFTIADVRANRPLQEGEGIFYFDAEKNSIHGYAHTSYIVVSLSDDEDALREGTLLNVVPIREPELRIVFNDENMNCVGRHRAEALKSDQQCAASKEIPGWGCKLEDETGGVQHPGFTSKCAPGTAAAFVSGYFKVADLERTITILSESLCATYAGKTIADQRGWGKFCSQSADWGKNTPNDPLRGGDWCSAENKAKDGTCIADSWKTETYLALQAFPIQQDPVQAGPKICTPKFRTPLD